MASSKRTKSTTKNTYTPTRVANVNATKVRSVIDAYQPLTVSYLRLLEDRRFFHPDKPFVQPAASPRSALRTVIRIGNVKRSSRTGVSKQSGKFYSAPPQYVGVHKPNRVAICVRRKIRREVLLAAGIGGKKVRRGKRNYASGFHC